MIYCVTGYPYIRGSRSFGGFIVAADKKDGPVRLQGSVAPSKGAVFSSRVNQSKTLRAGNTLLLLIYVLTLLFNSQVSQLMVSHATIYDSVRE